MAWKGWFVGNLWASRSDRWLVRYAIAVASVAASVLVGVVAEVHHRQRRRVAAVQKELAVREVILSQAQEREELLQLLDLAAVVVLSLDRRITRWSLGCQRLYGYTAQQALGRISHELLRTVFPEPPEQIRSTLMEAGRWAGEVLQTCADGRQITVKSEWVLHRDGTGAPVAILETCVDLSERKRMEQQLRRSRDELEKTAADLKRSNQDLEQFAYVSSHDLQEPLRAVTGYVQLLAKKFQGQLGPDADVAIGFIVDGASRMSQLINDLLNYSRVGSRGNPFAQVDMEDVLRRMEQSLGPAIAEAGATITHDALPTVWADPMQMMQLLQNLVSNAIKFRGEQPPRVHVTACTDGQGWVFCVQDNGIGIDPKYWERIFIIFQRLHGQRRYKGTGIGLAICKRIVERHGGRMWVDSHAGNGSTFYFTIAARRPDEPALHQTD